MFEACGRSAGSNYCWTVGLLCSLRVRFPRALPIVPAETKRIDVDYWNFLEFLKRVIINSGVTDDAAHKFISLCGSTTVTRLSRRTQRLVLSHQFNSTWSRTDGDDQVDQPTWWTLLGGGCYCTVKLDRRMQPHKKKCIWDYQVVFTFILCIGCVDGSGLR